MINVWWLKKDKNFGDILTPYILDFFDIEYNYTDIDNANIICIGSIIRHARDNQLVLGSGVMFNKDKINPKANYKFVRGPYTRQKIIQAGGDCPEIYGDAALLLPLICPSEAKKYDIGIVPHFVDYAYVKEMYPEHKIINVITDNPLEVAKEISSCKKIISSSLHGIIAAHAYGIPAAWVEFSNKIKGDRIKFKDHYASIGLEAELSTVDSPNFTTGNFDIDPIIRIFKELT